MRTDVLEECIASIIRVKRIRKLGTMLSVVTWHHIPKDDILHSYCCENLKSYIILGHICSTACITIAEKVKTAGNRLIKRRYYVGTYREQLKKVMNLN
jgi:hypothetical protein